MNDRLFDVGPDPVPEPKLSAGRRLTIRNNRSIELGVHPATGARIWTALEDESCGTCGNCNRYRYHNRSYIKCSQHRLGESHSESSDIRASWPPCTLWVPSPDSSREFEGALAALDDEIAAAASRIISAEAAS